MPSKTHEAYQDHLRKWFLKHSQEPDIRELLERHREAVLILWNLDLGAARPILEHCYSKSKRGRIAWDPIITLRLILLACLLDQPSLNKWVKDLKGSRVLRVLGGIDTDETDRCHGVGTFYDYLHRIHDGPVKKTCDHVERPSETERRRAKTPRRLNRRKPKGKGPKKSTKKTRRQRKAEAEVPAVESRRVTERLVEELKSNEDVAPSEDLRKRLSSLLIDVGIMESAKRGLLGDLDKLIVGGDGSKLKTGANQHGRKVCNHKKGEKCDCPRIYSDPDAEWGWDNHRECWNFGSHFYEISTSTSGHDLPLVIQIDPGNASDFTASAEAYELLRKQLSEHLGRPWSACVFIGDAGHDAEPLYAYWVRHDTKTVIPLKTDARATHPLRPDVKLSKRGVPLCQAGCEMAHWGSAGPGRVNFLCPVRANKLECCPLAPEDQPDWHCRPELKYGPTLSVKVADNPRLFPELPRNNPRFSELYKLRSGCERSNSVKKEIFSLERAHHRRSSFWLMRLYHIAILQHARAWVAEEQPRDLVAYLLGDQEELAAAA